MGTGQPPAVGAIELGRDFFRQVVRPAMERVCPRHLARAACGRFGMGSECLGMDDAVSRDHHWGPKVDILLPDAMFRETDPAIWAKVAERFPASFRGFRLEAGYVGGPGLAPEGIGSFLSRTIGRTSPPESDTDWLDIPEEDIVHVVNGEVWHDPSGGFSRIRAVFEGYYPDAVWKRRIAHWCRYASGMGLYWMQRARLRDNLVFLHTSFANTLKRTIELAFLLNRTYFPYDKWLYPLFRRLDHPAPAMVPLIDEATADGATWERRFEIMQTLHEFLDRRMVELGLVRPHPRFKPHATSGYRLLEWCYRDLLHAIPRELFTHVPVWDQKYFEAFTTGYVADLTDDVWQDMLHLEASGDTRS